MHFTEISNGKVTQIHLCQRCAAEEGYVQQSHLPVGDILNQLIQKQSVPGDAPSLRCDDCGMTWQEFKDTGLLGCMKDYEIFSQQLQRVVKSAHQGAEHHTGKTRRSGAPAESQIIELRKSELARLKKQLSRAVESESYEEAARLRDQIQSLQHPG